MAQAKDRDISRHSICWGWPQGMVTGTSGRLLCPWWEKGKKEQLGGQLHRLVHSQTDC